MLDNMYIIMYYYIVIRDSGDTPTNTTYIYTYKECINSW